MEKKKTQTLCALLAAALLAVAMAAACGRSGQPAADGEQEDDVPQRLAPDSTWAGVDDYEL